MEAQRLKRVYAKDIDLLVGLETEYLDEAGLERLEAILVEQVNVVEYIVGSVHHVNGQAIDFSREGFDSVLASFPNTSPTSQFNALFCAYFDAQLIILERLQPQVVGHFDLCKLYYPDEDLRDYPEVWAKVQRNIRVAQAYGALFEISSAAFRKGWKTAYPSAEVFAVSPPFPYHALAPSSRPRLQQEIQAQQGRFTLSDDSHGPLQVGQNYDLLFAYLEERNMQELYYLASPARKSLDPIVGTSRGVVIRRVDGKPWLAGWKECVLPAKK